MNKCAICGKDISNGLSGVKVEIMRGIESWGEQTIYLCTKHREAVYEAAKAGARSEIEKKEAVW